MLSLYLRFNNVWRVNITDCVIQIWPSGGLHLGTHERKNHRQIMNRVWPMATWLIVSFAAVFGMSRNAPPKETVPHI